MALRCKILAQPGRRLPAGAGPLVRRARPSVNTGGCVSVMAKKDPQDSASGFTAEGADGNKRRAMEDELRDPKNFLEFFLPRPLRLAFFGGSAASCLIAAILTAVRLLKDAQLQGLGIGGDARDLVVNIIGLATFAGLFLYDQRAAGERVEQRRRIREAQIRIGDREVYVNDKGEKMSKLKEVDDDWILRRLERWGRRDNMPFIGPVKGAVLQRVVEEKRPRLAVEVGTMAGYSALLIAQALPDGGRLISYEKDLTWVLAAKRFCWQASQGEKNKGLATRTGDKVDVRWGDAVSELPKLRPGVDRVDLLLLDGLPKEYLSYLKAAEPFLEPGAVVIADNAGVFAQGGLKPYLEYVRSDPRYKSEFVASTLEWRDDVKDGLEVSVFLGPVAPEQPAAGQPSGAASGAAAAAAAAQ